MAYVSLYRRYRPQTFADIVGQQHVTQTLIHALEEDRLHHAYLFTGPRGTGKTSTARILAKAVNCEVGPTPTPCGVCSQCRGIAEGSSVDVIELDMASHGGVDDARELRERALFAPASARRKVYILDEVHMASTAAFNALLKLVEEPPGHVLFAMATTDPQKVLPTIMSRVQRFDLRRVAAADVAAHLDRISSLEGFALEDAAADAIVRAGDGSVRDTLSVLEQVLAFAGREVTADAVTTVLGTTPPERTFACVDMVAAQDLAGLMTLVQELVDGGHDLRRFTLDLLAHLRDLLVLQVAPDQPDLVDATAERRQELAGQVLALPREAIVRAVDILAGTLTEQRQGPPRLPLELALAKLALPSVAGDLGALAARVARLEEGGTGSLPASVAPAADPAAVSPVTGPTADAAATPARQEAPAPEPAATPAPSREATSTPSRDAPPAPEPAATHVPSPEAPAGSEPEPAPRPEPAVAASHGPPPAPPGEAPAGGHAPAGLDPTDQLANVTTQWEAILDVVKRQSRRIHAVYAPARPAGLRHGVLTLRYPPRYASFHAANAGKGDFASTLGKAVEEVTGTAVRVEAHVEGEQRRPRPPLVGGGAAETVEPPTAGPPLVGGGAGDVPEPPAAEQDAVREAESAPPMDPQAVAARAESLLRSRLGAERITDA